MNRPGPHSFNSSPNGVTVCMACGCAVVTIPDGKVRVTEPCPLSQFPFKATDEPHENAN